MKLVEVIDGTAHWPPPAWLMRQAGRYLPEYRAVRAKAGSFLDLCYAPDLAAEVTLQPIRRFGFDAAIVFADILLIPQAMGVGLRFAEGEGPVLEPVMEPGLLDRLDADGAAERLQPVYETLTKVRSELAGDAALIGFCGAPWTVATYMAAGGSSSDHLEARTWAYRNPESFADLIDRLVAASIDYLVNQFKAGADVVKLFDSWAGILSEAEFDRWAIAPARAIVDGVRARVPDARIIGFPRGAGVLYQRYARETGISALALDHTVSVEWVRDQLQASLPVQGLLDPALLLVGGPRLDAETRHLAMSLGSGPYIFNLGHGIHKDTPPENVTALLTALRDCPSPHR